MPERNAFVDHCLALLAPLGPVAPRAMFGGWGFFLDGNMFGLIAYGQLYLKADQASIETFAAAGSEPFVYEGKGKPVTMSYWRAPEDAMEAPDALLPWAELAVAAARRGAAKKNKTKKPARQRKTPRLS
ncbi:TfoX/Sxy family protein [Pelagibius litoralis]|uniref:TfoX/Sxy family protein n=1 Tax=Pelagibius litoralis TaxID=374515 RepID=A0A967C4G1_9PROT|nr:TfoX/Sxy family protein [Pelagibius litoralis]NIA68575.1 TfoX/Sxy family protein [Pelagibius litoralis]